MPDSGLGKSKGNRVNSAEEPLGRAEVIQNDVAGQGKAARQSRSKRSTDSDSLSNSLLFTRAAEDLRDRQKELRTELSEVVNKLNDQKKELENITSQMEKDFKSEIEKSDKKSEARQIRSIEALGLFVALFSYISVTVQIFSRVQDAMTAALFCVLIFCILAAVIVLLDLLILNFSEGITFAHRRTKLDVSLLVIFLFTALSCVFVGSGFKLNPVQGTVEFDKAYEDRVKKYITDYATTTLYTKEQVQAVASSTVKARDAELLNCYENTGSLYVCLR